MKNKVAALTVVIMMLSLLPVLYVYADDERYPYDIGDHTTLDTKWMTTSVYTENIFDDFSEYFEEVYERYNAQLSASDKNHIQTNAFNNVVVVNMTYLRYNEDLQSYMPYDGQNAAILIFTSDKPFMVKLDDVKHKDADFIEHILRFKLTDTDQTLRAFYIIGRPGEIYYVLSGDAIDKPVDGFKYIYYWSDLNINYETRGYGINRWAYYAEKNAIINDPDDQDQDKYIYVTSSTNYYIDPRIFHDIDHAQTVLSQLQWHSKGYGRVAAYVHTRAGPFLLRAKNYENYDKEQIESLILPLAVNRQHFNNHSYFDIDIYVWSPDAVAYDDPMTAHPEGYTDKLQTIRVFFTQPPKTCPDGYNCDDPDPNKWVPIDPDRSSGSGLLKPKIPQKPDNNWDIIGWVMYIIDWIIYIVESIVYVLARIGELIVQFFTGATGFINILSTYFNFLPREIISVIVLGILTSLLAALLRR